MFRIAVVLLLTIFCFALIGPSLSSFSYSEIHLEQKNRSPCKEYWFGSDDLGRDLFCRTCWGARVSLTFGITAALLDCIIGVFCGALAAYLGGWVDELLMRICDILYAIPSLLIVILLTALIGPGFKTILISISLVGWINMARIVRAQILQLKEMDYVHAAKALGASTLHILSRHLIPNAISPILVTMTLTIPSAIFLESFLSFLGLGISAPYASWGSMINEGIGAMQFYPWRLFIPAAAITTTIFCLDTIGHKLRDILDPHET